MTKEERHKMLNELKAYAIEVRSIDLSAIIDGFEKTDFACTHEIDRIAEVGYLTCQCGKNMRWPENVIAKLK
jgi:hypothetical protein